MGFCTWCSYIRYVWVGQSSKLAYATALGSKIQPEEGAPFAHTFILEALLI